MSIGLARDQWNQRLVWGDNWRNRETDEANVSLETTKLIKPTSCSRPMKGNASLETELMSRSRLMKSSSRPGAIDHSLNHVCLDVIINNKTIQTIWGGKTLDSMHNAQSKKRVHTITRNESYFHYNNERRHELLKEQEPES